MSDKILNVKTKRQVNANGEVAKKLYNEHLKGLIKLLDADFETLHKIHGTGAQVLKPITNPVPKPMPAPVIVPHVPTVPIAIQAQAAAAAAAPAAPAAVHKPQQPKTLLDFNLCSRLLKLSKIKNIKRITLQQGTSIVYNGTIGTETFYVKEVVKDSTNKITNPYGVRDIELALNEVLASVIYTDVYGVDAIHLYLVINDKADPAYPSYMIASRSLEIDTCSNYTDDCKKLMHGTVPGTVEPLLVDCVLANWDVGEKGNVGIVQNPKRAFRIDVGGALLYRAMGGRRDYLHVPKEHITFFMEESIGYRLFRNLREEHLEPVVQYITGTNVSYFDYLYENALDLVETIPEADRTLAMNTIRSIPIAKQRHLFYLNDIDGVMAGLLERVQK